MAVTQKKLSQLPDSPGVYLFKNAAKEIIYVGRAASLKRRVSSYWQKSRARLRRPIEQMVDEVCDIKIYKTGTIIEALILEAAYIKKFWPRYNIAQRDDKSFLYMGITCEKFPRVRLLRGNDIAHDSAKCAQFAYTFGPFTSTRSLRTALDIVRRVFPWSDCMPPKTGTRTRACFYAHLGLCPGVCTGAITARAYRAIILKLVLFFQGKRTELIMKMRNEMKRVAQTYQFERAAHLRDQLYSLEHIQDIALLQREDMLKALVPSFYVSDTQQQNEADAHMHDERETHSMQMRAEVLYPRIEAYDISNISGTSAVGSMVVFERYAPAKKEYRIFKIKTVHGANDTAMLREVLTRRFNHTEWRIPDLVVIDGGKPQVNAARAVLHEFGLRIPLMGIAKGPTRKRDQFILARHNEQLMQFLRLYPYIVKYARDEAHRFAVKYHRKLRGKSCG